MAVFDTRGGPCESREMKTALIAALTLAVACGGPTSSGSTQPIETARPGQRHDTRHSEAMAGRGGASEGMEMAALPPEVTAFHDTLAPRWHAEHGAQRTADTCAAIPQLQAQAEAIAKAMPPAGANPADWSASARQLGDAVAALGAACKASDGAAFEQAFAQVHERFHGVMSSAGEPGEHSEHSEHGEHEHRP
jgi:hypothetical protein